VVFVNFLKRPVWLILFFCVGCSAQSFSPDVSQRIERQVRAYFKIPTAVPVAVGTPKPSEFSGYDTLPITLGVGEEKKTYEFLLSKDGNTLLRMSKIDISPQTYALTLNHDAEVRKKGLELMKKIDVSGRPWRGAKDAKVAVVVYDDFQCPYCSRMYHTLFGEVMKTYGDRVHVVFKDFPLMEIHPWAKRAAIDSNCLAEQSNDAYWDFSDYVHQNQQQIGRDPQAATAKLDSVALDSGKKFEVDANILQSCLKAQPDSALKASLKEADSLGVSATPTLFVNGEKLEGAVSGEELQQVLQAALRDAQGAPVMAAGEPQPTPSGATPAVPKN